MGHTARVGALAWNGDVLSSGSSQVCNLAWSKHSSELVSTHGYSQNQILVWKYPSLTQVAKLTGHSYRVLYLALSPDGEAIVTGAGDETLRFWNNVCSKKNMFNKILPISMILIPLYTKKHLSALKNIASSTVLKKLYVQ
nr:unnamed protein product [Callosobruchus analis]